MPGVTMDTRTNSSQILEREILRTVTEYQEIDFPRMAEVIQPKGWAPRTIRRFAQDLERAGRLNRKICFSDMRRVIYVMPPGARV
jgi:hypothetical protein